MNNKIQAKRHGKNKNKEHITISVNVIISLVCKEGYDVNILLSTHTLNYCTCI